MTLQRTKRVVRLALAIGLLAGAGQVAGASPADPASPPASASPDQIRAWIAANLDETGYVETATTPVVVLLYDPSSVRLLANGHVAGVFRSELFSPFEKDGHTIRSARKFFEIDCAASTYKEVGVAVFAGSNLHRPIPDALPAHGWTKPLAADSPGGKSIRIACERAHAPRP